MKFLFEYRTSDNARHNGVICALDREAAYAELKQRGIKPCRFSEAPGAFNKIFGKGKRWLAIGVLSLVVVSLGVIVRSSMHEVQSVNGIFDGMMRRQPIGDAAVIDEGVRTGWADVFELEGDRFLASFAIPGVPAAKRTTTEAEIRKALNCRMSVRGSADNSDSLEARQIRAMVEGMKQELDEFLADGGTIRQYGRRLVLRQEEELSYYRRAKNELDHAIKEGRDEKDISVLLEKLNDGLRKMGIKLLIMPEKD